MIVPQYWSESKQRKVVNGKQFTLKRFGWSDLSQEAAKQHADKRLLAAEKQLDEQGDVRRVDHKLAYNGAEGIPIREEVITRCNDGVVITRNAYGALCLNTPNVLFADIDCEHAPSFRLYAIASAILLLFNLASAVYFSAWVVFLVGLVAVGFFTQTLGHGLYRINIRLFGSPEAGALQTIQNVSEQNANLHLRVYRTPMGFRVLVMNQTFDPQDDLTGNLLQQFCSDPIYMLMCKNQNCFRARISPKPWRIKLDRLKPAPGVWPIKQKHMAKRAQWVAAYQAKAQAYAACHFVMALGSKSVLPEAEAIRAIHDEYSKVDNPHLPLA